MVCYPPTSFSRTCLSPAYNVSRLICPTSSSSRHWCWLLWCLWLWRIFFATFSVLLHCKYPWCSRFFPVTYIGNTYNIPCSAGISNRSNFHCHASTRFSRLNVIRALSIAIWLIAVGDPLLLQYDCSPLCAFHEFYCGLFFNDLFNPLFDNAFCTKI
jgi:hypothetical protein